MPKPPRSSSPRTRSQKGKRGDNKKPHADRPARSSYGGGGGPGVRKPRPERGVPGKRPQQRQASPAKPSAEPPAKPAANTSARARPQGYSTRPVAVIDLSAMTRNYYALAALAGSAKIGASVKADGYGLGAVAVARSLYGAGCRIFFVATAGEGKILRDGVGDNATIYVLNGPAPRDLTLFFGSKLRPVINSADQGRLWGEHARKSDHAPYSAVMIDTGMNRLGLEPEAARLLSKSPTWRHIGVDLLMSHLACADTPDHPMNARQLAAFRKAAAQVSGGKVIPLSLANTAGIHLGKPYHFQMVRPGIGLYGGGPTPKSGKPMESVVTLKAPVLQIRTIEAGESVGYDATFTAKRDSRLAVVGAGYADGLPIALSGRGHAKLNGRHVPIVGRISMDLTILDITDGGRDPKPGDMAEFLGDHLSETAETLGTITYELLVRLGQRCRRDYRRGSPS